MDNQTAKYIISYFTHLLNDKEKLAIRHQNKLIKLDNSDAHETEKQNQKRITVYKKVGWLTNDNEALALLDNGYEDFEIKTAERILAESGDKVYLNKCPNCGTLARTPEAKQCRSCGHTWRETTTA